MLETGFLIGQNVEATPPPPPWRQRRRRRRRRAGTAVASLSRYRRRRPLCPCVHKNVSRVITGTRSRAAAAANIRLHDPRRPDAVGRGLAEISTVTRQLSRRTRSPRRFSRSTFRTLGPTQNGRWRYTGELERQEAVRARVVVALLPAGVFLDRRSSRYGSSSTQPTRPRRAFAYVRLSLPCALFVFFSSPAVGHRHGVGLQVRVQRQQPVVVHQRRGQVHFTSSGHLPRQPQRQFYGQQHRIHLPSMFCVRS